MFRDESARLTSRAEKRNKKSDRSTKSNASSLSPSPEVTPEPFQSQALVRTAGANSTSSIFVPYPLESSITDRAATFFFANYVHSDPPFSEEYLQFLCQAYARSNPALTDVIEAVGLAGISNVFKAPEIMAKATQRYGRALTLTNNALGDPKEATTDATLMAIWFLGIYEVSRN